MLGKQLTCEQRPHAIDEQAIHGLRPSGNDSVKSDRDLVEKRVPQAARIRQPSLSKIDVMIRQGAPADQRRRDVYVEADRGGDLGFVFIEADRLNDMPSG